MKALGVLLPLLTAGCISLVVDGRVDGSPRPVLEARRLEMGRTTLTETLRRLGPPDLVLRVGDVDRLYYVAWESFYVKLVISASVPAPGRSVSTDAFIAGSGSEELRLARLEFDRGGVLRDLHCGEFTLSSHGEYIALDNRIVENFLEDRARSLQVSDEDDDDDLDRPPPKK